MKKYVVRLYDGFDNEWIDVCRPCNKKTAEAIWNEKTDNGTKNACYGDIDYYKIFESDTIMHFSEKGRKLRKS